MTDLSRRIIRTAVDWSAANLCLADYLAGRFTYRTREEWVARIISGEITVNEQIVPPEKVLELHDRIEYRPQDIIEPEADLDHQVLFEDDHLMVIVDIEDLGDFIMKISDVVTVTLLTKPAEIVKILSDL